MNCHSLSEPILCLIRDVPYSTVGKQDEQPGPLRTNIYSEDKYAHSNLVWSVAIHENEQCVFLQATTGCFMILVVRLCILSLADSWYNLIYFM